jgi:hypothetical protein
MVTIDEFIKETQIQVSPNKIGFQSGDFVKKIH